jgi:hypothetical protein
MFAIDPGATIVTVGEPAFVPSMIPILPLTARLPAVVVLAVAVAPRALLPPFVLIVPLALTAAPLALPKVTALLAPAVIGVPMLSPPAPIVAVVAMLIRDGSRRTHQ